MTDHDARIEYPEWCDTEDKKQEYRDWLDIQWTYWFLNRCLENQEQSSNSMQADKGLRKEEGEQMTGNTLNDRITRGAVKTSDAWMYLYDASEAMGLVPDPIATREADKAMRAESKKKAMEWHS